MRKLTAAAAVTVSAMALFTGAALAEKLTIGLASEPTSMDPHFHNLGPNNAMLGHIFGRLVDWDAKQQFVAQITSLAPAVQKHIMNIIQSELLKEPVKTREETIIDELTDKIAKLELERQEVVERWN